MRPEYELKEVDSIYSPALLFYKEWIEKNVRQMVTMAGRPERLRPHAKTHKTREIVRMQLEAGVTKQKCATIAEAELLARSGVKEVLLAYGLVGPNCDRLARLVRAYPETQFSTLADHPAGVEMLSRAMKNHAANLEVLIDLDVGQHRTGIEPREAAARLYEQIGRAPGLQPGGLHVYDGHNHQPDPSERAAAVRSQMESVLKLRDQLIARKLPVPRLVCGCTPTFPVYASLDLAGLECAPGTCLLHDHGYGSKFPDLPFTPAALLLTRVVSRPLANRVTLDLGYKALASDPPVASRGLLIDVPDARIVLQNEEHMVIETTAAGRFQPGDALLAIPYHVCPTCALHKDAYVIEQGKVVDRWEIVGRDRVLSV
jgi:D-serine deaminase-like pyridoxal phosphate-dependent protein